MELLYTNNDNILTLIGLTNEVTGSYINDATVTVTVKDESDVVVDGGSFPVTMTYVTSSNGNYQGLLGSGMDVTKFEEYRAFVTISGDGYTGEFQVRMKAAPRRW